MLLENDHHFYCGKRERLFQLNPNFEAGASKDLSLEIPLPAPVQELCDDIAFLGGRSLLVGGTVRDKFLGQPLKDLDFEVYGIPSHVLRQLLHDYGKTSKAGEKFEVFKLKIEGLELPLDFSIPRRESKNGKRHQDFEIDGDPSMTICEAAQRRDLTINTLAYDPLTKTVYDCFGGLSDLENGIIRFANKETFQEDPLRVFRVMQFASRFNFTISEETKGLCQEMVNRGDLDFLPPERITEEIWKMLRLGKKISFGLRFAQESGILDKYWPELQVLGDIPQEQNWHPEGDVWTHTLQTVDAAAEIAAREKLPNQDTTILTLAALCHDLGKSKTTQRINGVIKAIGHEQAGVEIADQFLKIFSFPEEVKKSVLSLINEHLKPIEFYYLEKRPGKDMTRALYHLADRLAKGKTNLQMLAYLIEADQRGRNPRSIEPLDLENLPELLAINNWVRDKAETLKIKYSAPKPLLQGRDVMAELGLPGGLWIGLILRAIRVDQLEAKVTTRDQALLRAKEYYTQFSKIISEKTVQEKITELQAWKELSQKKDEV